MISITHINNRLLIFYLLLIFGTIELFLMFTEFFSERLLNKYISRWTVNVLYINFFINLLVVLRLIIILSDS